MDDMYNVSILYIDDDDISRHIFAAMVSERVRELYVADCGEVAIELFKKHRPGIVVTDLMMPKMNGIELVKKIKAISKNTEFIMVSSAGDPNNIIEAINNNIRRFILKPLEIKKVLEVLDEVAKRVIENDELVSYRESLEKMVQERIIKLADANEKLVEEIESRKKLEQELIKAKVDAESASKAKSMFLANMSHEIRTPLNGIFLMCDLLLSYELDSDEKEVAVLLKKSAKTLLDIINDILDFSKIEAGKITIKNVDFSLEEVIKEVMDFFKISAEDKKIWLKSSIEKNVFDKLNGDPKKIVQILTNIMGNAFKFTESGGITLTIKNSFEDENSIELLFTVEDTGLGMSKETLAKVFQPFEQGDSSYTKKFQGTGLGLTITKKLVEFMEGKIWLDSMPDKGTKVYFILSFKKNMLFQTGEFYDIGVEHDHIEYKNILLVEDNRVNQKIMKDILEVCKGRVVAVADGLDALRAYKEEKFDIVIMDIQMPNMDGIQAARLIREYEKRKRKRTPILAVTAYSMHTDINNILDAEIDDYLIKPIGKSQFIKRINEMIE